MRTHGAISKKNTEAMHSFYDLVCKEPGINAYAAARKLNLPQSNVYNWLSSFESLGLLLAEDDEGGLFPFSI